MHSHAIRPHIPHPVHVYQPIYNIDLCVCTVKSCTMSCALYSAYAIIQEAACYLIDVQPSLWCFNLIEYFIFDGYDYHHPEGEMWLIDNENWSEEINMCKCGVMTLRGKEYIYSIR